MTSDDIERLLRDMGTIGPEILSMRPSEEAAVKRKKDSKYVYVFWKCRKCGHTATTKTTAGIAAAKCCMCSFWMEWHYV